jgi:hypothetical protein
LFFVFLLIALMFTDMRRHCFNQWHFAFVTLISSP